MHSTKFQQLSNYEITLPEVGSFMCPSLEQTTNCKIVSNTILT